MSALGRVFSLSFFAAFLLFHPAPSQAQPNDDPFEKIVSKISLLEKRLQVIEANQKEILSREEQILAELDRLRIWIHRR